MPGGPPSGPGRPNYDAETWRHFELVDLAYLDEMVLVEFAWTDPATDNRRPLVLDQHRWNQPRQ